MPQMHLRHGLRYRLWHFSDEWEHASLVKLEPSQSPTASLPAKLKLVNFAGMPGVKTGKSNVAGPLLFSYRNSIPGSTGSHVTGASAADENHEALL